MAVLSWEGDRPGGADDAWLDRHGEHYVWGMTGVIGPEYLGRFATTIEAVAAGRQLNEGSPAELAFRAWPERWAGPTDSIS